MNQTSWTAFAVALGFFVYITVKGQLPQYEAAIFGGKQNADPNVTNTTKAQASGQLPG